MGRGAGGSGRGGGGRDASVRSIAADLAPLKTEQARLNRLAERINADLDRGEIRFSRRVQLENRLALISERSARVLQQIDTVVGRYQRGR